MKRLDVSTQQGYKSKLCIKIQKSAGNIYTPTPSFILSSSIMTQKSFTKLSCSSAKDVMKLASR